MGLVLLYVVQPRSKSASDRCYMAQSCEVAYIRWLQLSFIIENIKGSGLKAEYETQFKHITRINSQDSANTKLHLKQELETLNMVKHFVCIYAISKGPNKAWQARG